MHCPSPIINEEGGSLEPCANSSSFIYKELNGEGAALNPIEKDTATFESLPIGTKSPHLTSAFDNKGTVGVTKTYEHPNNKEGGACEALIIYSAPTYDRATPAYDCVAYAYDCTTPTYVCVAPTCNAQYSNTPFASTAKLNNEADID